MKEIKEEITVTSKRVTKVVSADGAFSRFVSQDYPVESEQYKESLENAKKAVEEYDKSAKGTLGALVASYPHVCINGDSYAFSHLFGWECCDGCGHIFKVENEEQLKNICTWALLECNTTDFSFVAFTEPRILTHKETYKDEDGVEKTREVQDKYHSTGVYSYNRMLGGKDMFALDPKRFVGKDIAIIFDYDNEVRIMGTVEECKKRAEFFIEKELKQLEK